MATLTDLITGWTKQPTQSNSNTSSISIESQAVMPEKFGAKPNINTYAQAVKNTEAIRKCGFEYKKIDLSRGVYYIANDIRLVSGTTVNGCGNETIITPTAESSDIHARGMNDEWFSIFNTNVGSGTRVGITSQEFGDSNNVSISNLTIVGGFSKQKVTYDKKYPTTVAAIFLQGSNNKVNNVTITDCAKGMGGGECFPIRLAFGPGTIGTKGGEVRNCDISNVGYAGLSHKGIGGDEITCIAVSGYGNKLAYGVIIEGNTIHDIPLIVNRQISPINSIACSATVGARIQNNNVINVDGCGFYVDNWENLGMLIQGNNFHNVARGIFINAYGDSTVPLTLGLKNSTIQNNNIFLKDKTPEFLMEYPCAGIVINSPYGEFQSTWIDNVAIVNNVIRGYGPIYGKFFPEPFFSRGIYLIFNNNKHYKKISILNNLIDTPDIKAGSTSIYPSNNCLSLYYHYTTYNTFTSEISAVGNKTITGKDLKIMICNPDYSLNKFV